MNSLLYFALLQQVVFLQTETIAIQIWGCQGKPSPIKPSTVVRKPVPVADVHVPVRQALIFVTYKYREKGENYKLVY